MPISTKMRGQRLRRDGKIQTNTVYYFLTQIYGHLNDCFQGKRWHNGTY